MLGVCGPSHLAARPGTRGASAWNKDPRRRRFRPANATRSRVLATGRERCGPLGQVDQPCSCATGQRAHGVISSRPMPVSLPDARSVENPAPQSSVYVLVNETWEVHMLPRYYVGSSTHPLLAPAAGSSRVLVLGLLALRRGAAALGRLGFGGVDALQVLAHILAPGVHVGHRPVVRGPDGHAHE